MNKIVKIISFCGLWVLALACSKDDGNPLNEPNVKSNAKEITSFAFHAAKNDVLNADIIGTIDQQNGIVAAVLPPGANVAELVPTVEASPKASVTPDEVQNFTKDVIYTVTAEDGSTTTYTVRVSITPNSEKQVLGFVFLAEGNSALEEDVTAAVDEDNKTITATLPNGTNAKVLLPTLELSEGATLLPEGAQDFTKPVGYTITAEDGSSTTYEVVVEVLTDRKILIKLYNANPGNTLEWDITDQDISTWKGVTTNSEGRVVELDMGSSALSVLPVEIGQLDVLSKLSLANNRRLSPWPPEIGNLINLIELNVTKTDLASLPPEVGNLINLDKLILTSNDLVSLPDEIGQLTNMTNLNIGDNKLNVLPASIGGLIKLEELGLYNNKLESLPDTIGNLSSLITLFLEDNQLKTLPETIGSLANLETLDISKNVLEVVPPEIGNLNNLTRLNLFENLLNSIPRELGNLQNLKLLLLRDNGLTAIPKEVCNLENEGITEIDILPGVLCSITLDPRPR